MFLVFKFITYIMILSADVCADNIGLFIRAELCHCSHTQQRNLNVEILLKKCTIYRIFSNLIRTSFCRFLKRKKKSVRGSNPQFSFNRPLPTRQTDRIILDVTNALTVIRLTRRV
jgi:hypothetical protein